MTKKVRSSHYQPQRGVNNSMSQQRGPSAIMTMPGRGNHKSSTPSPVAARASQRTAARVPFTSSFHARGARGEKIAIRACNERLPRAAWARNLILKFFCVHFRRCIHRAGWRERRAAVLIHLLPRLARETALVCAVVDSVFGQAGIRRIFN